MTDLKELAREFSTIAASNQILHGGPLYERIESVMLTFAREVLSAEPSRDMLALMAGHPLLLAASDEQHYREGYKRIMAQLMAELK